MEVISLAVIILLIVIIFKPHSKPQSQKNYDVQEWHDLGLIRSRYDTEGMNSGFVYFVKESGNNRIKIGKAKDPERRIQNDFGTIMPYEFDVVHLINSSNYHKTENLFHQYFHHKRFKGEWFDLTEEDLLWIKNGLFPREIEDSIKGY